jgi:hypothetical protein
LKASHILCAMLACAPLTFEARTTASSEDGRPSVAAANAGEAAGRAAPSRDAGTGGSSKGRDAAAAVSPRRGSVTPQRGVGQTARVDADRLHSLLSARARGRLARQPDRSVGSNRAATAGPGVREPQGVKPAGRPPLVASNSAASPAARPAVIPRNSTIGGPQAQGFGRVGGPAISRTIHSATIDGTQASLRRGRGH